MAYALSHEFTHFVEEMSPQKFRVFTDILFAEMGKSQVDVKSLIDGKMAELKAQNEGLSESELRSLAYSEAVAEMMETAMTDTDVLTRISAKIQKTDSSLWGKIKNFLQGLVEKLKSAYRGLNPDSAIARLAKETIAHSEAVLEAFSDAAADAVMNYQLQDRQKNTAQEGGRFSTREQTQQEITKKYQTEVDSILSMQDTTTRQLIVGYTPGVYGKLGMPLLPLTIGSGHVYSAAKTETEAKQDGNFHKGVHYHGLGEAAIKNIYSAIQDPVMVIAAKDVNKNASPMRSTHSVVAIIDIGTAQKSLLVPIEITAERKVNGTQMDVNTISSVYERPVGGLITEAIALENSGDVGVFYAKKEALTLPVAGVQFPVQLQQSIASDGIVHRLSEKVNMKISEVTQSQQFKRWFGDWQNDPANASKVVNADGTPKVMYHGTDGEFTVFDRSKGKKKVHLNVFGDGNYFTALETGAARYGKNVMGVYLNIKNPYISDPAYNTVADQMARDFGLDRATYTGKDVSSMLKARGYDGVLRLDENGGVVIANAFDQNQIKSATDNIGTFDKSNPDIRFSSRVQQDSEYMELAKDPEKNREKLESMVEQRAREAGYTSPMLYHGTQAFGFTAFDLSKMDDGRSIFLTSSPDIASTYSGVGGSRKISEAGNVDVSKLSPQEVAQMLNRFPADDSMGYSYSYVKSKAEIASQVDSGLAELNRLINTLKEQYGKDSSEAEKLQKLQETIYTGSRTGVATQLWVLSHRTDVFGAHEDFIDTLEQNLRTLEKVKNTDGGFYIEKALGGYSIEVMGDTMARETLRGNLKRGNYAMYAKLGNTLTIDAKGGNWNNLPTDWAKGLEVSANDTYVLEDDGRFWLIRKSDDELVQNASMEVNEKTRSLPEEYLHDLLVNKANVTLHTITQGNRTTRAAAEWAKNSGYDSVVFRNITDNGGQNEGVMLNTVADVYVIFDPNNAKSADAVTYDDSGNVIPLSQRFNVGKDDIRFSSRVDSAGRELSEGQAAYFANSEVRDEDGKLIPVYHSTGNEFYSFDRNRLGETTLGNATDASLAATALVGHWFSDHDLGNALGDRTIQSYLNIENPYTTDLDTLAAEIGRYAEDAGQMQADFEDGDYTATRQAANAFVDWLRENGYDGLVVADTEFGGNSYVVLDSEQAKLTTNRNPTGSKDIRFSQREFEAAAKQFSDEITQWDKDGRDGDSRFILGSTGEVLQGLGAIESDIYMNSDKVNTILKDHPEITLGEIKKIPQILNDPILVLKSRNAGRGNAQNTRMVIFGSVKGQNGMPVMTVFDLRPQENHFVIDDMQKVTSAYTKTTEPVSFIKDSFVLYADKKRTTSLLRTIGFHMPIELLQSGYIGTITYTKQNVNTRGEKFSNVFREGGTQFSSRQTQEVRDALREYRRQRDLEYKTMKTMYESQLRQVEQAYQRLESEYSGTMAQAEEAFYQTVEAYEKSEFRNEHLKKTLAKERKDAADKVERDKRTELRGKTFRAMNAINRMLLNPGKTLYVPDSLQPAVIQFMQGLTGEIQKSPNDTLELRGNLESLQAAYANLANLNKGVISPEIHEGVAAMLSDAMDAIGDTEFKDLNRKQLTAVHNAVKSVLHTIRNANKMYAENLRGTYGELADLTYREFSMQESREKVTGAFREQADTLSWNMEKPVYAAMRLGSDTMLRLYQNLRSGEDTWARDFREARAYAMGTMAKYNYDKFADKIVTLTDRNGKKVGLNLEERMSLYACARREQAVQHLTKGGFVLSSRETRSVKNKLGIRSEQRVSDFNTYVLGEGQAETKRCSLGFQRGFVPLNSTNATK